MDNGSNTPLSPELALQPPAGDQAQPSSPAAADKAAADKAAADKAASHAGAKTRARVKAGAAVAVKPGARRRKASVIADDDQVEEERVAVVLKTSRLSGRNGRPVPRRTTAFVTVERALSLMLQGDAREATPAEAEAAADSEAPVFID